MKRSSLATASLLASLMFVGSAAHALSMHWGVFPLRNSRASGLGNPAFCVHLGASALRDNGFTNVGTDPLSAWGWRGGTGVVVICTNAGGDLASATVFATSEDDASAAYWRSTIRSKIQSYRWL